jgi:hypothetical protein
MTIVIMNFLTFGIFGGFLFASSPVLASETYDLEKIRTVEGREYRGIVILEADRHGLSFRHDSGIAKLPFASLSENLRMLFEAVDDIPAADDTAADPSAVAEEEPVRGEVTLPAPVILIAACRVRIPPPVVPLGGGYTHADRIRWPVWWSRYDPAHELANPYFRELAVRDFLYSSGLVPTPRGIAVRTFYR